MSRRDADQEHSRRLARRILLCGVAPLAALGGCVEGDSDVDLAAPPAAGVEVRPDTPGNDLQFNFDRGDEVEFFDSSDGRFRVHFTRLGDNAVPDDDDDASGTPDFVEEVAAVYVDVLAYYEDELGFRAPLSDADIADNGGGDQFDVYLVDFAGIGDGAFRVDACDGARCIGFMTQENDYAGYGYPSTLIANRILGSHEFFHAVQAAYDSEQGSVLAEGTAVWATESFDPSLEDFEAFIHGYLDDQGRPLDTPPGGPVPLFSYGSAIFFQFLEERYGAGTVRSLIERTEDGANGVADPVWFSELPALLEQHDSTFGDAFVEFVGWNLATDDFGDPQISYADSADYPRVKIQDGTIPLVDDSLRIYYASASNFAAAPGGRASMTAALVAPPEDPDATTGLRMLIGSESGDAIAWAEVADVGAASESIDTTATDRFIVSVINPLQSGDSKQPALCIGTAEEVEACRLSITGEGEGGAGGGDGSGGGAVDDDGDGEESCGCRLPASRRSLDPAGLAIAAAALVAQRLRRRARVRR